MPERGFGVVGVLLRYIEIVIVRVYIWMSLTCVVVVVDVCRFNSYLVLCIAPLVCDSYCLR